MAAHPAALPPNLSVLERGWLSSNSVLLTGGDGPCLVDTGYALHAEQTVALVRQACIRQPLRQIVNTHLHSDHCGGNAALQLAYPHVKISVPASQTQAVVNWDEHSLTYAATGQQCPRFSCHHGLHPGQEVTLAGQHWQVHAAPGHDNDALMFFQAQTRTLISADALWEDGFGVLFPLLLHDEHTIDTTARTLRTIEQLRPAWVIPGHGAPFHQVEAALQRAHGRLAHIAQYPDKHRLHAAQVLIKFHLMQVKRIPRAAMLAWALATPYLQRIAQHTAGIAPGDTEAQRQWIDQLLHRLMTKGAIEVSSEWVQDVG
jgi:glyoxylase-like metal-dependent hydrolase (beta-lactamase superfamily II)